MVGEHGVAGFIRTSHRLSRDEDSVTALRSPAEPPPRISIDASEGQTGNSRNSLRHTLFINDPAPFRSASQPGAHRLLGFHDP
jgi:hypothetical protein